MDKKEPISKRIFRIGEKVRRGIFYVAVGAAVTVLGLSGVFLRGTFTDKNLGVLVVAALCILFILFEILREVSQNLKVKPETSVFDSLLDARPKIQEIVSQDKKKTSVKIIAATGQTTVNDILPCIIQSSGATKIEISMGILAPEACKEYVPTTWPRDIETTIKEVGHLKSEKLCVNLFKFGMLPAPHGLMLNDGHLFLGFFGWAKPYGKTQLYGAQLPHYYYHTGHREFAYYRNLFESWFEDSPRQKTPEE